MPDDDHTECPACRGRLYPKVLHCADCGLDVTTRYAGNEFADLDADDLHLLRIFVVCEGRIRDMEAALGVSYPTVKSRLSALRGRLGLHTETAHAAAQSDASSDAPTAGHATRTPSESDEAGAAPRSTQSEPATAKEILDLLADGRLTYEEALPRIRALRSRA